MWSKNQDPPPHFWWLSGWDRFYLSSTTPPPGDGDQPVQAHSVPALQSWWSTSEASPQPCDISDNWNGGIGFCLLPTKPPLRDSSTCGETYNNCKEIVCEDLMISTRIVTITLWHSWLKQWYRFFLSSTKPYFWFQYHKDQRVPVPAFFSCEK